MTYEEAKENVIFGQEIKPKFCKYCGQAIDWSEE